MISRQQLIDSYQQACEIELQAYKPGNVSTYNAGHDMTVDDFRMSYRVSSEAVTDPEYSLGEKIYHAVKATRDAVGCNTNLGIVLLCAPLFQALEKKQAGQSLRQALKKTLDQTSRADADWVFQAIQLASPGGLGESNHEDVSRKATMSLTEAMKIASHRDRVAYQFATCYKDIFEFTFFVYNNNFEKFGEKNWAALAVFSAMLALYPDSHIERKYGNQYSDWVATEMGKIHNALATTRNPKSLISMLDRLDKAFKVKGINPGTTADITVATVLVVFLEQLVNGEIH